MYLTNSTTNFDIGYDILLCYIHIKTYTLNLEILLLPISQNSFLLPLLDLAYRNLYCLCKAKLQAQSQDLKIISHDFISSPFLICLNLGQPC